MEETSRKIAQNTALQLVGKTLGTVLSLATFALLVHRLGTDGFGALTIALNFAAIFGILVDFGFTLTANQMLAEPEVDEEKVLGNIFGLRLASAIVFLTIGAALVFLLPYRPEIQIAAVIACGSFFFGSVASVFVGFFQKRLALKSTVFAELLNRLCVLVGVALLLSPQGSIITASAMFLIGGIVQVAVMLLTVNQRVPLRLRAEKSEWLRILRRSWPIGVSIAFNLVYLKGDIFFLSLFGRSDTEIGLYGSAYKVVDVATTVPIMFMGLVLPLLVNAVGRNDWQAFRLQLQRAFDSLAMLGVPLAFGAAAVGGPLLAFIKPDLFAAGPIMTILGFATMAVFFGSLFGHTIVALHKQKPMILGYAAVAVLATLGYILTIPVYGAIGAAWVTLGSEILIALITAVVVLRTAKTTLELRPLLRVLGASAVMFGVLTWLPNFHVLLQIAIGIVVYFFVLGLLGGPSLQKIIRLFTPSRV